MLTGKVAVVTGGVRGIGRAIALKLAENGGDIAILCTGSLERATSILDEIHALGRKAAVYACNVADMAQVNCTFREILEDFGHIDILINNAGITRDKLVLSMKPEDFNDVIDVNLKGAFHTIKQAYPLFAKQKSGKIINISSVSGLTGNPGQANYAASKAGLVGLTKTVAKELASRGICCNAIAPGFVKTDMTEKFEADPHLKNAIPMKRMADPEEIAELALFLASPKSNYITGEVIRIDGGLAM